MSFMPLDGRNPTRGDDPLGGNVAPWFTNIPSGTPFDAGRQSLDYSLQLSVGLANYNSSIAVLNAPSADLRKALTTQLESSDATPQRDGGGIASPGAKSP